MTYKEIMKQLKDLREHCNDMLQDKYTKDPHGTHQKDVDALDEAMDIIADYEKATAQNAAMMQKYEMPEMAVRRSAGLYTCPLCGKRTQVGHTHCHWCGKKLSWDREAYASKDYPHLGRKRGKKR